MIEEMAEQIITRLSAGQKSCIMNLDCEPTILGCSEPTAKRLAVATTGRPALVTRTRIAGEEYARFSLNEDGLQIQSKLDAGRNP